MKSETGRLAATPTLQRLPLRTELGRQVQRVFDDRNRIVVDIDYSQLEIRLWAAITKSKGEE